MNYQNRGLCYLPKPNRGLCYLPQPSASADNTDLGFDNSWYHAKTEFWITVLLYIFHIIHPQKQMRSVRPFCFWGEHSKGLSNQADVELNMINAISVADIAFIMSSSQAIVNWLNALDQSDFSQWVWCIIITYIQRIEVSLWFWFQPVELLSKTISLFFVARIKLMAHCSPGNKAVFYCHFASSTTCRLWWPQMKLKYAFLR